MTTIIRNDLIARANALGPVIRQHAERGERERRLAPEVVKAMREAGLFRLYVPESLGGFEADPITVSRITETISGFDSAAGWALQANTFDWWLRDMSEDGLQQIYASGPDVTIASAFHPPMRAVEVEGGYRITGRSPLASNCRDATWLMFPALIMDGEQPRMTELGPVIIGAVLPQRVCEIVDTWYTMGMRSTDSNDVVVNDVFVSSSMTTFLTPEPAYGRYYQGPLYRIPAMAASAPLVSVGLAIARASIAELSSLAKAKTPFVSTTTLALRSSTQAKIGQAEALLRAAGCYFYDTLEETWQRTLAGQLSTLEQKAEVLLASIHAMQTCARVVELMYSAAGSSAIYTRSPLERHFRDIQVLRQHGFLSENRYETIGQVYLGLPPDLPLIGF
jgi:alkylation response protein AidB-like acyl-CoA dehydrogenase